MEAKAVFKYVGSSPRKMRLVIDLVRGKAVEEALSILHFTPKHAAKVAEKVLRSAISNLQNKEETGRVDTSELYIKEAFVNGGPSMKRIRPAPMGRAYRIRKRSNHITIIVAKQEQVEEVQARTKVSEAEKTVESKSDKAEEIKEMEDTKKT